MEGTLPKAHKQWPNRYSHVIFVSDRYPVLGGVTTVINALGSELINVGVDVHVIVGEYGNLTIPTPFPITPASTHPTLHGHSLTNHRISLKSILALPRLAVKRWDLKSGKHRVRKILARHPGHTLVIFTHPRAAEILRALGAYPNRFDNTVIGQWHSSATSLEENAYSPDQFCEAYSEIDALIALSESDAIRFRSLLKCPCYAIPNPTPVANTSLLCSDTPGQRPTRSSQTAVALARYSPQKNLRRMIRLFATATTSPDLGNWKLHIYGDGPARSELTEEIARCNASDRIRLMGYTDDVAKVLSTASLHLVTSTFEGFPMSVMEASQAGVPTIAFDCGSSGLTELLEACRGNLIPYDDDDAYVATLRRLARDAEEREMQAEWARQGIARYSGDAVLATWAHMLDELRSLASRAEPATQTRHELGA